MTSPPPTTCPRCGAPIPASAKERLCPACLLSGAIDRRDEPTLRVAPRSARSGEPAAELCGEFGGYRLHGLLGRGGMGAVYEAEQVATGRRVALKVLGQELDSPDMRQRFLREGRLAAGVSHPNSLYVFGSEEIEGVPVITMEIAPGGTLKDRLARRGPLPVPEAVDAILDVIAGLEAAAAAGVLHRDVKPSNCFVSPDGSVKIGDFGLSMSLLARDDSFATASGVILGTPAYASPEQLRGDTLDLRADIYSVGATLFTLLTGRAPFEGDNAVQVVANVVNQPPKALSQFRADAPPELGRILTRCLAKEPANRPPDYQVLRNALLPFSSREPEPASLKVRAVAGWIDFLLAFFVPYVAIMLAVGAQTFHLQPLIERSLYSGRYYFAFLAVGFLYFAILEGFWGAGPGKRLKGLKVVRRGGHVPGFGRALLRIALILLPIECVRVPFLLATVHPASPDGFTATHVWLYVGASNACPWLAVLLTLTANARNGYAAVWDQLTGTRVVILPTGTVRSVVVPSPPPAARAEAAGSLGPFRVQQELVPGQWLLAVDPVLRRPVWLLRRSGAELSPARKNLARPGRLRWLQCVTNPDATWDAYEALPGLPWSGLVAGEPRIRWGQLRHWLHDLASELWAAAGDGTLPTRLSLDQVWLTAQGRAVLLDEAWPEVVHPAPVLPAASLAGQQRFLSSVAAAVDSTGLPLHARPFLRSLDRGTFEKLSFLAGHLRGLLDRPAEVSPGVRAGSMFMLPFYVWVLVMVGSAPGAWGVPWSQALGGFAVLTTLIVLGATALAQLISLPFGSTASQQIFRLAIVDTRGERAGLPRLLLRWTITWPPILLALGAASGLFRSGHTGAGLLLAGGSLALWLVAATLRIRHPNRNLPDRLAGTWVVRR